MTPQDDAATTPHGGDVPAPHGGDVPAPHGGDATTPRGDVPAPHGGDATTPRGDVPAPRGGDAATPLAPGFAAPVLDAQRCFRLLLEALGRPGRVQALDLGLAPPAPLGPAAAAVLLTLADADTPVWQDAGPAVAAWLRFHAGCPLVEDPGAAAFLLACGGPPALGALDAGTEEEPHRAATLVIQVAALEAGRGWRLTGPGIEHEHRLRVDGLPDGFLAAWAASGARFPRGIDVVLCAGDRLAGLPRTTRIEEG